MNTKTAHMVVFVGIGGLIYVVIITMAVYQSINVQNPALKTFWGLLESILIFSTGFLSMSVHGIYLVLTLLGTLIYVPFVLLNVNFLKDISHERKPIPYQLRAPIIKLRSLGFQLIGTMEREQITIVASYRVAPRKPVVYFLPNKTGLIYATIEYQDEKYKLSFHTMFKNRTSFETAHRKGRKINAHKYQLHYVSKSLETAYTYHHKRMHVLAQKHGRPVSVKNTAHYIKAEKVAARSSALYSFTKLLGWITIYVLGLAGTFLGMGWFYSDGSPLMLIALGAFVLYICMMLGIFSLIVQSMDSNSYSEYKGIDKTAFQVKKKSKSVS